MADVVDRDVLVLAPEERDRGIALAAAEQVARGRLALPLGDDPVLDAQPDVRRRLVLAQAFIDDPARQVVLGRCQLPNPS